MQRRAKRNFAPGTKFQFGAPTLNHPLLYVKGVIKLIIVKTQINYIVYMFVIYFENLKGLIVIKYKTNN